MDVGGLLPISWLMRPDVQVSRQLGRRIEYLRASGVTSQALAVDRHRVGRLLRRRNICGVVARRNSRAYCEAVRRAGGAAVALHYSLDPRTSDLHVVRFAAHTDRRGERDANP